MVAAVARSQELMMCSLPANNPTQWENEIWESIWFKHLFAIKANGFGIAKVPSPKSIIYTFVLPIMY